MIDDIDHDLGDFQYILQAMLAGIIPYSAGRRKDKDGRRRGEHIEKAEGAQVDLSGFVDGAGEADWAGRYGVLQIVLPQDGAKLGEGEYHAMD